jgi:hypothetical protein
MITGAFHLLSTDTTPEVLFDPAGIIKVKGRALVVNNTEVPDEMMKWIDAYLDDPPEITTVIIAVEYLNSFSTSILVSILKKLTRVILRSKKLVIQWYYEEDDEDILERGEYIASTFNIPINFILTTDTADL